MSYFSNRHLPFISYFIFGLIFLFNACNMGGNSDSSNRTNATTPPQEVKLNIKKGTVTSGDRSYPTLEMDSLTWLGANLDIALPESWCYNTKMSSCEEEGRLYRWQGAKEACTALGDDWRLPTEKEWQQLAITFGGYTDWLSEKDYGDPIAANQALIKGGDSGFEASLSGWRGSNGGFDSAEKMGFYWTSTETAEQEAWFYIVLPRGSGLTRRSTTKRMGMACRCVKNN